MTRSSANIVARLVARRASLHLPRALGERAADTITRGAGSWPFAGVHVLWFSGWIMLHIERWPYGLLTLLVSLEAIFLATFVLMSQNRQATRDRARDDVEAQEVALVYQIVRQLSEVMQTNHDLNKQQIKILTLLRAHQQTTTKEDG